MNAWTSDLPRIPGHYWVSVPGFERAPDIEHVENFGDGLVVRYDAASGRVGDVYSLRIRWTF